MQRIIKNIILWLVLAVIAAAPAHALLLSADTPKYRVMGYAEKAPGRFAFCPELKLQLAMGCDVRGEEIASGQADYCNGDPVNGLDPDGRYGKGFIK